MKDPLEKPVSVLENNKREVFTIGHGNRHFENLVETLGAWSIHTLVDIRSYPRSKRNPQFDRAVLTDVLPEQGIRYVWLKAMGGFIRKGLGEASPHAALDREGLRKYADHMLGEEFQKAVTEIMDLSGRGPVCLMCAEIVAAKCHRWLAADHLTAQGWKVIHLLNQSEYKCHRLSSHARIQDGQVFYDRLFPTQYASDLST